MCHPCHLTLCEGNTFVWQLCEGAAGCARPMSSCEAFGCNPNYPSDRYEVPEAAQRNMSEAEADLMSGVPRRSRPLGASSLAEPGRYQAILESQSRPAHTQGRPEHNPWDDTPPESTWGSEPDEWSSPLRPLNEDELWPGSALRGDVPRFSQLSEEERAAAEEWERRTARGRAQTAEAEGQRQ